MSRSRPRTVVRIVGRDFTPHLLHGTTARSARAFIAGKYLPPRDRQRTLSEFGDVIYTSEPTAPHQALMFAEHGGKGFGGRQLVELDIRRGTRVLDLAHEMVRTAYYGNAVPLRFSGRPSITGAMTRWLNAKRSRPLPRGALDPTHPNFIGGEYPHILAAFARERGYCILRLGDEALILRRTCIVGARRVSRAEIDILKNLPRLRDPSALGSLYSAAPDRAPPEAAGQRQLPFLPHAWRTTKKKRRSTKRRSARARGTTSRGA